MVLERPVPALRDLEVLVFLDLLASTDEAEDLREEEELPDISLVPVLKLMGIGHGGLEAARRGLLAGLLVLWLRGLVIRAKGAS